MKNLLTVLFPSVSALAIIYPLVLAPIYYIWFALILLYESSKLHQPYSHSRLVIMLSPLVALCIINSISYASFRYFIYASYLPISFIYSLIMTRYPMSRLRLALMMPIIFLYIIMLIALIKSGFMPGYSYESLLGGEVSSNGFTSVLLILTAAYVVLNSRQTLFTLLLSSLTLFFTIFGYGRASPACAFLILISIAVSLVVDSLRTAVKSKLSWLSISILLSLLVLVLVLAVNHDIILATIPTYTKFRPDQITNISDLFHDPARNEINLDYLNNLGPFEMLFGSDSERLIFHTHYLGNPHSSFINSHRLFGVLYFASFFAVLLTTSKPLYPFIRVFASPHRLFILSVVLLRCSSEPILFASPLDFILFSCLIPHCIPPVNLHAQKTL